MVPLHSYKFLATLQHVLAGYPGAPQRNPLILRVDVNAGHGGGARAPAASARMRRPRCPMAPRGSRRDTLQRLAPSAQCMPMVGGLRVITGAQPRQQVKNPLTKLRARGKVPGLSLLACVPAMREGRLCVMRRQADGQDHGRDHRRVCVCGGRNARALGAHPAADAGARAPPRPRRAASCARPGCSGRPDAVPPCGPRPIRASAGGVSGRLSAGSSHGARTCPPGIAAA